MTVAPLALAESVGSSLTQLAHPQSEPGRLLTNLQAPLTKQSQGSYMVPEFGPLKGGRGQQTCFWSVYVQPTIVKSGPC